MSDKRLKDRIPPEFRGNLVDFYQMSLNKDSEESSRQSDEFRSPIYSELKSISSHYADKYIHAMGGMKVVCKVHEQTTGREIAMAEMKKGSLSEEAIEQFLREARVTAALEHPNIVPIYEIGLDKKEKPFFTMRFLSDESLRKVVRELMKANPVYTKKYPLNMLLEIFLKVCDAVAYAHSRGIVHLDIKPDNIMLGEYGEVYICDWGLARQLNANELEERPNIKPIYDSILDDYTLTGVVKGTPGYMAPEQVDKKFGVKNERTDIYALGALLYTLLVLKRPYADLNVESTLEATKRGELPEPVSVAFRQIPESLSAICMKAMAVAQRDRYQSVDELTSDIRSYQGGFATDAEEVSALKSLMLLLKRNRLLATMIVLVVFTGIIVGAISGSILQKSENVAAEKLRDKDVEVNKLIQKVNDQYTRLENLEKLVADRVVAKWSLDEAYGITVKNEIGKKRGLLHNGPKWVKGYKGNALALHGKGDYASFGDLKCEVQSLTLWVKLEKKITKKSKPMTLFQHGNDAIEDIVSFGVVSTYAKEETLTILGKGDKKLERTYIRDEIEAGWHHIALVWDQKKKHYRIFIDGDEKKVHRSDTDEHTPMMKLSNFKLGTDTINDSRGYFSGLIDEVTIYGRVLSGSEVKEMAAQ